jgi:hypothetical protein
MLVRHKVADFAKWKAVYDAHASAREKAGLKEEHLLRSIDNPNEVTRVRGVGRFTSSDAEGRSK